METKGTKSQLARLIALLVCTAILIVIYDHLPQRKMTVVPNAYSTLYSDNTGETSASWNDEAKLSFRCKFQMPSRTQTFCGMNLQLGDGDVNGVDLSHYRKIHLEMTYNGSGEAVRLYFRNFSLKYSAVTDSRNSSKYNGTLIMTRDLNSNPLTLTLGEFSVAEWWLRESALPRALSFPEFTNIVNLGIDFPYPTPEGNHDIQLKSLVLSGPYISKENWYLLIISIWSFGLVVYISKTIYSLRKTVANKQITLDSIRVHSELLAEQNLKYKELSILDELTGCMNRRGGNNVLETTIRSMSTESTGLILLDIDYFKRLNDTHGHNVGDEFLTAVGLLLLTSVRRTDTVCRWGGEEFLIVCPNSSILNTMHKAERLRLKIMEIRIQSNLDITISASIGVSSLSPEKTLEESIETVDKALYLAKNSGRNCCKMLPENQD
ncbi:GGDEF domain-containing protein [Teredinibacter waterburyi]|uniref:GGDEF domain-containing protein n=1 Tax=Teredinibacter waterburyi TaxID=1500538 RepID=UPI00165FCD5F|nr:GGDEF domain-containing protein [Teredinibacter waterburyi]